MVLNEIEARSRLGFEPDAFLDALAAALDPPSVVVIIEPALRAPGRGLLRLHDAAVASGAWRVVAPCTHQLRCPLLRERDRSWCHFRFEWRAPSLVREVADPLGLDWRSPALAFLALERASEGGPALQMSSPFAGGDRARVIGDLMRVAGGREGIYVCRDGERILMDPVPRGVRRGDVIRGPAGGTERVELAWTPRRRA
jgi:hypothetical protein